MGRADLIGAGKHHLIPAWQPAGTGRCARRASARPQHAAKPAFRTQHTGLQGRATAAKRQHDRPRRGVKAPPQIEARSRSKKGPPKRASQGVRGNSGENQKEWRQLHAAPERVARGLALAQLSGLVMQRIAQLGLSETVASPRQSRLRQRSARSRRTSSVRRCAGTDPAGTRCTHVPSRARRRRSTPRAARRSDSTGIGAAM